MKKIHKDRLLKLAKHLEKGKLIHENFDFECFNMGLPAKKSKVKYCNTNGCALGECPAVFPSYWHFEESSETPVLKTERLPFDSADHFFGLKRYETEFLFMPSFIWNHSVLPGHATAKEVAEHIKKFVKHKGIYDYKSPQEIQITTGEKTWQSQ